MLRGIFRELGLTALTFAGALLMVCMTLGTFAIPESNARWADRTGSLLRTLVTRKFDDGLDRIDPLTAVIAATGVTTAIVVTTITLLVLVAVTVSLRTVFIQSSARMLTARSIFETALGFPVLFWCTALVILTARVLHVDPLGPVAPLLAILALFLGDRLLADLIERVELSAAGIMKQPHMRTVQAGDFGVTRHLLQGLCSPIAAAVLSRAMFLVSGAIVIEWIFRLPGLGRLVLDALISTPPKLNLALLASVALIGIGALLRMALKLVVVLSDARPRASI